MRGKFVFVGDEKLYIRGVTYGTFRPIAAGEEGRRREVVERDFTSIAASGMNAVRTYTLPPRWLLDAAQRHGLRVMVGMPWEQHTAFLDERGRADAIERLVRKGVHRCVGHPAVLCYAIGNEIPAAIVRWLGYRRVERFLERLYGAVKAVDPDGLVTYVNYPSTEYLRLPFLDLACFNVYLESEERLDAYIARLQNLAGDRPLVMAEIGLDSRRNGEEMQAHVLDWQVRTALAGGCAGVFAFAWTDEWHRGGCDVEDWDFGLTRRDRSAKPALAAVARAFADAPLPPSLPWPRISVVVCTYDGWRTIRECLEGIRTLEYRNYEVIVVDDGSPTDAVARIVGEYDARLIRTENRGLSAARNAGLAAAAGEIVAYIDDDAHPDPHWLTYLAATFLRTSFVGVGGPNLPPPDDGLIAKCVAHAPGGPIHVLLSDREAEHIPGCNMAFRKAALEAVGGFDPQFRAAGDDVDLCWRLRDRSGTLGFSPAAVVWHRRRDSLGAYWRQQRGYGRAEALLERKWPERYNALGHLPWSGRIYSSYLSGMIGLGHQRIYYGTWGSAPFQSLYQPPAPGSLRSLVMMPEWYLVIVALAALCSLGTLWTPLLLTMPILGVALAALLGHAALSALAAPLPRTRHSRAALLGRRVLTASLHLLQPLARLHGRVAGGLTPWRRAGPAGLALPLPRAVAVWSETWQALDERLRAVEAALRAWCAVTLRGGEYDRWDLEVRGGMLGVARMLMTVEEHDQGRQLARVRVWAECSTFGRYVTVTAGALTAAAALCRSPVASAILGATTMLVVLRTSIECASAMSAARQSLDTVGLGRERT